ncbi:hypothetical protein DL96DRAFT_1819452 [Flagelloscypha sp. PMI_526]|nr:hypothetical protein DL96DRAFT_1819452 [Flagelloscypha sp. PMI_526]
MTTSSPLVILELIELIISFVDDDRAQTLRGQTLHMMSLVSPSFTASCQKILFRHISLTEKDDKKRIIKLFRLLDKSPHIAPYIESLHLDAFDIHNTIKSQFKWAKKAFSRLTNVHMLQVQRLDSSFPDQVIPELVLEAMIQYILPTITVLDLRFSNLGDFFVDVLPQFSSLQKLNLLGTTFSNTDIPLPRCHTLSGVRWLTFSDPCTDVGHIGTSQLYDALENGWFPNVTHFCLQTDETCKCGRQSEQPQRIEMGLRSFQSSLVCLDIDYWRNYYMEGTFSLQQYPRLQFFRLRTSQWHAQGLPPSIIASFSLDVDLILWLAKEVVKARSLEILHLEIVHPVASLHHKDSIRPDALRAWKRLDKVLADEPGFKYICIPVHARYEKLYAQDGIANLVLQQTSSLSRVRFDTDGMNAFFTWVESNSIPPRAPVRPLPPSVNDQYRFKWPGKYQWAIGKTM